MFSYSAIPARPLFVELCIVLSLPVVFDGGRTLPYVSVGTTVYLPAPLLSPSYCPHYVVLGCSKSVCR